MNPNLREETDNRLEQFQTDRHANGTEEQAAGEVLAAKREPSPACAAPGRLVCAPGSRSSIIPQAASEMERRTMSFASWLRTLRHSLRQAGGPSRRRPTRRRPLGTPGRRLLLEILEDRSLPSTVTWVNPAGGDWDTGSNWSTGTVPGAGDDVQINTSGITVTHGANVSESVHSPTSAADLNFSAGSLQATAGVVSTGTLTVEASASLRADTAELQGTSTIAGSYQAATATEVSNATATFTGAISSVGALTVNGSADFSPASGGPATLTFSSVSLNGTLSGTDSFVVSGALTWTGGTLQGPAGSTLTAAGGASVSGGIILDGRTLNNDGAAAWSTGNFTVQNGGTLNNAPGATFGSLGNTSTLYLNGGTLAGSGTINANVANNGQVAPAAGGGSLILNGNYVQGSTGTLRIGLAGTAAGTGYSQLVANGSVTLDGSLAVSLSFLSAVGDQFAILHNSGAAPISGTFAGLPEGTVILLNGQRFQISYVGGAGNDVLLIHLNTPPTLANLAVTSPINEGSTATLTGGIVDPDPLDTHTLVVNWGDGSTADTFSFGAGSQSFRESHQYLDNPAGQPNGSFPITVTVTDNHGGQGSGASVVQVNNVAPAVGSITAPQAPVQINTAVSASASFTDPGILDTHTALWNWGDGSTSAGTVTESNGSGSVTGSHTYSTDGVYTVSLTVTDNDGAAGTSVFQYVVAYNPSAGFVTGGGWITSPAGAVVANPALTGKANFGFNAKYKSGATVPTGQTLFQFPAGNLSFQSTSYDWLVITTNQAQYQGSGTINGAGNYGFLVTALDNGGGSTPDDFRLQIWDKNNNNAVVYDTQPGASVTAAPTTPLGGGRIQVHTNAQLVAGGANPAGGRVDPLTSGELQPVIREAIARWAAAGIDAAQLSALGQVTVGIAAFPGPWLGMAFPGAVWVAQDAAGYGWSLDAPEGGVPLGKVDLLTVVEHELGHELGLEDNNGTGLMGLYLAPGVRRDPVAAPPTPTPAGPTSPLSAPSPLPWEGVPNSAAVADAGHAPRLEMASGVSLLPTIPMEVANAALTSPAPDRQSAGVASSGLPAAGEGLPTIPTARADQDSQPPLASAAVPSRDGGRDEDLLPVAAPPAGPSLPDDREPAVSPAETPAAVPGRQGEPNTASRDAFFQTMTPAERGSARPGAAVPDVGRDEGTLAAAVGESRIGKGSLLVALLGTLWGAGAEDPESRRPRRQWHE
jgi:hypothetical protein